MNDSRLLWEADKPLSERLKIPRNQPFDAIPVQLLRKVRILENPKRLHTPQKCCNYPKNWTVWCYHTIMCAKDVDRIANSVDLGLDCLPRPICLKTLIGS